MTLSITLYNKCLRGTAYLLQKIGDNARAITVINKLIQRGEALDDDWWSLGILHGKMDNWDKAHNAFLKAHQEGGNKVKYLFWLGKAEEQIGNTEEAEELYDKVLSTEEEYFEALLAKGEMLLKKDELRAALPYFKKCIEIRAVDAHVLNNMALCYGGLNQLHLALKCSKEAVDIKPCDKVIRYNYALLLTKNNNYHQAIEEYKKIKDNNNVDLLMNIGFCYGKLEDYQQSINYYKQAQTLEPENKEICLNLATLYSKCGDIQEAYRILKELVYINPYDADLLNNIGWIYETMDQNTTAEDYYYRGLALEPENLNLVYNLVCCLKKQHKFLEALDIIHKIKENPDGYSLYWSSLAEIYEKLGAKTLAVEYYNKSLGLD